MLTTQTGLNVRTSSTISVLTGFALKHFFRPVGTDRTWTALTTNRICRIRLAPTMMVIVQTHIPSILSPYFLNSFHQQAAIHIMDQARGPSQTETKLVFDFMAISLMGMVLTSSHDFCN